MRNFTLTLFTIILMHHTYAFYGEKNQDGYAIVRTDTIYGKIEINFSTGAILVRQDTLNRMFLTGVKQVTLLNEQRETFVPYQKNEKTTFYKLLVDGEYPLLEGAETFYSIADQNLVVVQEQEDLYDLFGKKNIKDYIFIRNVDVSSRNELMDLFDFFNKNDSF